MQAAILSKFILNKLCTNINQTLQQNLVSVAKVTTLKPTQFIGKFEVPYYFNHELGTCQGPFENGRKRVEGRVERKVEKVRRKEKGDAENKKKVTNFLIYFCLHG